MAIRKKGTSSRNSKKEKTLSPSQAVDPREFGIVGVGASAGGLEAFVSFLKELPQNTRMAYVFVQHQDPTHASSLSELLRKSSPVPLHLVEDRMKIQPNNIYVIPHDSDLYIADGLLRLNPRRSGRGPHLPIDTFFLSLAEYSRSRAIGVILSGTASDGTRGLQAIKEAGGIAFAQDEKSAKYAGMPNSAIASGAVDYVLSPEEIALEIARIAAHPFTHAPLSSAKEESQSLPAVEQIFALLRKHSGVDFSNYKPTTIMRRISRRMMLHRSETLTDYLEFLKKNPKSIDSLYEDMLINVTNFFRDPQVFDTLKHEIFPKLVKVISEKVVRIWIPGCSTGEEAYSIAMALSEYLAENARNISLQIFATDVSEVALEKARSGMYPPGITSDVSPERLRRFFIKTENGFQISKSIRDFCVFARHNVVKDPPFSRMDLISCRNLLIYLGPVFQKKVVPLFHYALSPNGYLLLGTSESVGNFPDYFYPADKKYKIYSKKAIPSRMHYDIPTPYSEKLYDVEGRPQRLNEIATEKDIMREGDRLLLSRYAPASVIVNDDGEILQFRGSTGPFLEPAPGQASLNIMKMAREGIVGELRTALMKAKKEKTSVKLPGLVIHVNGSKKRFNLEVTPFTLPRSRQYFYIIFFETIQTGASAEEKRQKTQRPSSMQEKSTSELLRNELAAMKEYLQSIIEEQEATNEELRAANEEILSSNEELQSTNEEMETAKEELQSANEELTTVNEELQVRNTELSDVANDLTNLLSSVQMPIVMLGRDLKIRKFTPIAERVLNLIPTDIGRPITDININLPVSDISLHIMDVIDKVQIKDMEILDRNGRWYRMHIRPYKTADNRIDGAVLVLADIEYLKRNRPETYFEIFLDTVQQPCVVMDYNLQIKKANPAFLELFQLRSKTIQGRTFYDLDHQEWNFSKLIKSVEKLSPMQRVEKVEVGALNSKRKLVCKLSSFKADDDTQFILIAFQELNKE